MALKKEILALDNWIRRGQAKRARTFLKKIAQGKVDREDRAELARLAWRCDLPLMGIRLLGPIVRPSPKRPYTPTDSEKAEYAACLNLVGAKDEALRMLDSVSVKRYPQALLYRSFALVSRWDYTKAVPVLRQYLKSPKLTPYQGLVGRINLAAALVWAHDYSAARALLRRLIPEAIASEASFAHGICLELEAICHVDQGHFRDAEAALARAAKALAKSDTDWSYFVRKWSAISALLKSPSDRGARAGIAAVSAQARERGDWESVRLCDYYEAKSRQDPKLAAHVYFGTPFPPFRERLLSDFGGDLALPATYDWELGEGTGGKRLELLTGGKPPRGSALPIGHLLHRLLQALSRDFYRAQPVAALCAALYPDEPFHPDSSPARVHEAVKRLRQWLAAARTGVSVEENQGEYRLSAKSPVALVLTGSAEIADRKSPHLARLKARWPTEPFSVTDACELLDLQRRTLQRLLEDLHAAGQIQREGKSRATRYRFG